MTQTLLLLLSLFLSITLLTILFVKKYFCIAAFELLLPALFIIIIISSLNSEAQSIAIGGPYISPESTLLESKNPLCRLVSESLCKPLVFHKSNAPGPDITHQFALIDSLKSESRGSLWKLRLDSKAIFSNGSLISANDVLWSLAKCQDSGGLTEIESITWEKKRPLSNYQRWIVLTGKKQLSLEDLTNSLSRCPIFHKKSSEIFGQDLGIGTNLLCSGDFKISNYRAGKVYTLQRHNTEEIEQNFNEVEIRGIKDGEEGLSLVRSGTLALAFVADQDIIKKTQSDDTLKSGQCQGYDWISRKNINFDCANSFNLTRIKIDKE